MHGTHASFMAFALWVDVLASPQAFAAIKPITMMPAPTRFENLNEPARLAQAEIQSESERVSFSDTPIKGRFYFEQMPNSVIISYRLAGLLPKTDYQIFIKDQPGCDLADLSPATGLRAVRGNRRRVSQNTFSNSALSVAGNRSILGKTIVVTTRESQTEISRTVPLACGVITALDPSSLDFEKDFQ